jgi:protein-S-isoprenylcysteine O-methyltransferase Ste14
MPSLGPRGEGWVLGQIALVGCWLVVPRYERRWPVALSAAAFLGGVLLAAYGACWLRAGLRALGSSLSPFPRPKAAAVLVTDGVYRRIRHPIYTGVVLLLIGLGMITGNLARIALGGLSLLYFNRKAALEERWLAERFPAYAEYRHQVRWRLLPGLW